MEIRNKFWFRTIILITILLMAVMPTIANALIIIENGKIPAPGGEVRIPVLRDGGGGSGMSGYDFIVSLSDPSVAEIKDAIFPQWASLTTKGVSGPGSLRVSAVDLTNQIRGSDSSVPLLTLVIRGKAPGSSMINLNVKKIDDDSGNPVDKDYTPGIVMVGGETATEKPTILPQVAPPVEVTSIVLAPPSPPPTQVETPQEVTPTITETPQQIMEINFTEPLSSITTPIQTATTTIPVLTNPEPTTTTPVQTPTPFETVTTTIPVLTNPEPTTTTPVLTPTTPETFQVIEKTNVSTNGTEIEKTPATPLTITPTPGDSFSIAGIFPFSLLIPNNTPHVDPTRALPNVSTTTTVPTESIETLNNTVTNSTTQPDNTIKGQFVFNSIPPQAEVYIGGRFTGVTPLQVPDLKPGIYEIVMKMEGYEEMKFSAVANPGKVTQVPQVVLKQKNVDGAGLVVSSLPPDADIYLNEKYFGRTPITLKDLPSGKTQIILKKPGYRDATHDITLVAGVTSRVSDIPLYPL